MRDSLKSKSVLTYSFADGNGRIEIRWDSFDAIERRHTYHTRISTEAANSRPWSLVADAWAHEFDGPRSGSGDPVSLPKALGTVLGFLGAFSESRLYGSESSDNWNLFPDHLAAWAEAMADEFAMAREEIEPSDQ